MKYDVAVIGSGPGGYLAASMLCKEGLNVAVIEKNMVGGECTNWGCIPSKALIEAGHLLFLKKAARHAGITMEITQLNKKRLMTWVRSASLRSREGIKVLLREASIIKGTAKLLSPNKIRVVGDEGSFEDISAEKIIIATGTEPATVPGFAFDGKNIIHNRDLFELDELPNSIVIIGGGAIGTELAFALANVGVEVHLVEITDRVLPFLDSEMSYIVSKNLKKDGVKLYTSSEAKLMEKKNGEVSVAIITQGEKKEVKVEKVLIAAGRRFTTKSLGLENAGVETAENGAIIVNEEMRTTIPTIFAVGDVTGPPFLAHKAYWQAVIASETILKGTSANVSAPIPMVIYSDPEIGYVGLSEKQALSLGREIKVVKFPYTALPRDYTVMRRTPEGFAKLILEKTTGRILGAAIIGNQASEVIHIFSLAIAAKLTANDLKNTIYAHPTYSELARELAFAALGRGLHG